MKIIIEENGYRMELEEDVLEQFSLSAPSDVHHLLDGARELGRTHVVLVGLFKEGLRPEWRKIGE